MDGLLLTHSVWNRLALAASTARGIGTGQVATIIIAIIGLTVVMLSTRRRARRSQGGPAHQGHPELEDAALRRETTRDLEEVMLELDELSREIHGRLNTKLLRLESLIRDADRRIKELSRFGEPAPSRAGLDLTVDDVAPGAPAVIAETKPRASVPPAAAGARPDHQEQIYRLADRGTPHVDIAREVGRTIGEVELVLALRKTRKEALSRAGA